MVNEFKDFCTLLDEIGSPIEARTQIATYLRYLKPSDQIIACNFLLGEPLENVKIGINKKKVEKVLVERYGILETNLKSLGDGFLFINETRHSQTFLSLSSINNRYALLSGITADKERSLYLQIIDLPNIQKKYFVDIMLNKLQARIGFSVIKYSLAEIYGVLVSDVEYAYNITKSMSKTIGFLNGATIGSEIGQPISPQLARDISKYI